MVSLISKLLSFILPIEKIPLAPGEERHVLQLKANCRAGAGRIDGSGLKRYQFYLESLGSQRKDTSDYDSELGEMRITYKHQQKGDAKLGRRLRKNGAPKK